MAIKILKKSVNIELCHELFKTRVHYDMFEKHHLRLRLKDIEATSEDVAWIQRDGFWMYMPDPWNENYFGLSDQSPSAWDAQSIACTLEFQSCQTGAFGRDEYGGILALHTGNIPGCSGKAREVFWQHYQGARVGGVEPTTAYAVVAHLGALDVPGQLRAFLDEVVRIQDAIS